MSNKRKTDKAKGTSESTSRNDDLSPIPNQSDPYNDEKQKANSIVEKILIFPPPPELFDEDYELDMEDDD